VTGRRRRKKGEKRKTMQAGMNVERIERILLQVGASDPERWCAKVAPYVAAGLFRDAVNRELYGVLDELNSRAERGGRGYYIVPEAMKRDAVMASPNAAALMARYQDVRSMPVTIDDADLLAYATRLREADALRAAHAGLAEIQNRLREGDLSLEEARAGLHSLAAALPASTEGNPIARQMAAVREAYLDRKHRRNDRPLSTGVDAVDVVYNGGMRRGKIYCVAGRPGAGKTTFALGAIRSALRAGASVLLVSLEMDDEEIVATMASQEHLIYRRGIFSGKLEPEDETLYDRTIRLYSEMETMFRIASDVYAYEGILSTILAGDYDLVVVDYLQMVRPPDASVRIPKTYQIQEILNGLGEACRNKNSTMLVVAQLHREAEEREPQVSHLKDSGYIEQIAHGVLMIHRPERNNPEYSNGIEPVRYIVGKNRSGPSAALDGFFYRPCTSFLAGAAEFARARDHMRRAEK
jgi:replicative DNA helicase